MVRTKSFHENADDIDMGIRAGEYYTSYPNTTSDKLQEDANAIVIADKRKFTASEEESYASMITSIFNEYNFTGAKQNKSDLLIRWSF
jgi:hypothetical protein